jgi:predicted RNase H-like HicB family nuclease
MTGHQRWSEISKDQGRPVYEVVASRDGKWWALRVPELRGVYSQVRRLDQAEDMARDAIAAFLDNNPESFGVSLTIHLPADVRAEVDNVIDLRAVIEEREREYAELSRRLAARLVEREGLSIRDAGRVLGVSHQRVAQLMAVQ